MSTYNWSATSLGPLETWPQSLRTVVDLMLGSCQPVYIAWGSALASLYNDAYIPILGVKHPDALGKPFSDVWAEIWDDYRPMVEATMAGEAQYFVDQPVALAGRAGRPVSWFTFSWTPLRDEAGVITGFYCAASETTEKVYAEQALRESTDLALRESEARYRTLFQAMDEGYVLADVILDEAGQAVDIAYVEANPAAALMVGTDLTGRRLSEVSPHYEPYWYEIWGRVARTGRGERLERYAAPEGRWYDFYVFKPEPGNEESRRVAVVFNDITQRKRAEEALRQSEARLTQVQQAAGIGSFDFDKPNNRATASPEYLALYGLPESRSGAFSYEDWVAHLHPDDRPRIESETRTAVANPACSHLAYEFRIIRADTGETRWIRARTRLVRDSQGRFVRSLGAQWDVTAEKNAEAALRESEARFRHMADSAPALIWMTDEEGQIVFANMHYDYLFGRPAAEMTGEGWRDIVHPEDLLPFEQAFFEAFSARRPFRTEVRVLDRHGTVRWLRCEGVPRLDDAHRFLGYTGCNVDITDAKVAEERRDLLINELNHRVKNTLATVQSLASQTLRNAATTDEARRAIEVRLIALSRVHDVLTRENWEGAWIGEVVAQAVTPFFGVGESRFCLRGAEIRLSPRTALALAMALQELATNAVKYGALSNDSGEVHLSWLLDHTAEVPRLLLRWEERGGPPVTAPSRRGFGSRLIERSLAQDLGGDVKIDFAATGVVCTVDAPLQLEATGGQVRAASVA